MASFAATPTSEEKLANSGDVLQVGDGAWAFMQEPASCVQRTCKYTVDGRILYAATVLVRPGWFAPYGENERIRRY